MTSPALRKLSLNVDFLLVSTLRARQAVKGEDDHFYGAWVGGSADEGGHPASKFQPAEMSASEFGSHYSTLEGMQRESVEGYCREDYGAINGHLRGYYEAPETTGLLSSELSRAGIEARISHLDAAMEPLPQDMILHRGMSIEWDAADDDPYSFVQAARVGESGIEDGYLSASLTRDISQIQDGDIEVELHVPAGTPSIWAMPYSGHRAEQEVILARGLKLEITDYQPDGGQGGKSLVVVRVHKP